MLAALLLVLPLCLTAFSSVGTSQNRQADWTFMVYLDGDCDLESAALIDFVEMGNVGSDENVKILVLLDRIPGYDNGYDDWTDTRRGIVNNGDVPDTSWGTSVGELNLGDPQTLIDFVEWGMQSYPASKYAVVLWDHGSGWDKGPETQKTSFFKRVCYDDTDNDQLRMKEVRAALDSIETHEQAPDLLGFDACLMAMVEVAYEIREHADVMVGSEEVEPGTGWPFDTILEDLVDDPSMSAFTLGDTIVSHYIQSVGLSSKYTQSATDLALMDSVVIRVNGLAQALRENWSDDACDWRHSVYEVQQALSSAVTAEAHGSASPGSHGLAIYFPEDSLDFRSDYNSTTILFPGVVRWEEFLWDFYRLMGGSWVATARAQTQEYHKPEHIDLYHFCEKLLQNAPIVTWVDFYYVGSENGMYDQPYNTLAEGVAAAAAGETICIKAGSSAETPTITKNVILRSCGGSVIVGE
jgi:hypothetical protein